MLQVVDYLPIGKSNRHIYSNRDDEKDLHNFGNEDRGEDESDAIDIDNEEELVARGLKKISIEGEEEEYLMDAEGNVWSNKMKKILFERIIKLPLILSWFSILVNVSNIKEISQLLLIFFAFYAWFFILF